MEDSLAPKMRYKVIGSRKPKRVSKGPWKAGSENGEEVQGKQMSQGCPRGKWDIGALKLCKKRPNEHTEYYSRNSRLKED